jgi:molecular chaperone Hsp33
MSGALMLTALQKGAQQVTVVIKGDGPLGEIVADADPGGGVRGYVSDPAVILGSTTERLDVDRAIGRGTLTVTRWLEARPEPFHGTVSLVTGGVARDIAEYLLRSEQVPSAVSLGELLTPDGSPEVAGGYIIQALPGASSDLLYRVESAVRALPPLSDLLEEVGSDAAALARLVSVGAADFRLLERIPVAFRCGCSRNRGETALVALGREGLEDLLAEQDSAEVRCQFCGEAYRFGAAQIRAVIETLAQA